MKDNRTVEERVAALEAAVANMKESTGRGNMGAGVRTHVIHGGHWRTLRYEDEPAAMRISFLGASGEKPLRAEIQVDGQNP